MNFLKDYGEEATWSGNESDELGTCCSVFMEMKSWNIQIQILECIYTMHK